MEQEGGNVMLFNKKSEDYTWKNPTTSKSSLKPHRQSRREKEIDEDDEDDEDYDEGGDGEIRQMRFEDERTKVTMSRKNKRRNKKVKINYSICIQSFTSGVSNLWFEGQNRPSRGPIRPTG